MQNEKSKITAYALWLVIGAFGAHRFYLGRIKTGILLAALLVVSIGLATAGGLMLYRAVDSGASIETVVAPGSSYIVLTSVGTLMFFAWAVWYLLDLIFIHTMMKKDQLRAGNLTQKKATEVFE